MEQIKDLNVSFERVCVPELIQILDPKNNEIPIKKERTANVLNLKLNSNFNLFISNNKTKGNIAKNPTKNLTALKVNGPISSIPVS